MTKIRSNEYWAVIDKTDRYHPELFDVRNDARQNAKEHAYLTDAKLVVRKVRLVEIKGQK